MKNIVLIALTVILGNANLAMATGDRGNFSITGSGYFINSNIKARDDGLSSFMSIAAKSKQLGEVTINVLGEVAVLLKDGVPQNCTTPLGDQGIAAELVKTRGVIQQKISGDQIFTKGTALSLCISNSCFDGNGIPKEGCTFQPISNIEITGGTGKFACASGKMKDAHTRTVIAVNPVGEPFGSISEYKADGKILLSNNCNK